MSSYDKWIDEMIKARTRVGLGLRDAFEGGEKAMLEKVRKKEQRVAQWIKKQQRNCPAKGLVSALIVAKQRSVMLVWGDQLDQLAKEAGDE